jgi:hypothetical protein
VTSRVFDFTSNRSPDPWLRSDARGSTGRFRKELAAGGGVRAPMSGIVSSNTTG